MLDMPKTTIRRASPGDVLEISDLIGTALARFLTMRREPVDRYIAHSGDIADGWNSGDVLVVEDAEGIAGTVTYMASQRRRDRLLPEAWATFRTLAVHPRARGRGLGTRLVNHCIEAARTEGAPVIGLHAGAFMATARGTFDRAGFVRCPEQDLFASSLLAFDASEGDLLIAAYRLDFDVGTRRKNHHG
ncbi:GNAT family N-acetyltransferase [Mesorhizobium sp. IMUNJ 23232]|uniref:GNAT family N-acetyltransferase n=1 Tax=Mesorhizobium sp. IMUNJ 23232 TaxID=3376064 RepID=UPI0037A1EE7E